MKIISGIYKGRAIKGFDIEGTRPTMDRVKESLFATIQEYINGSIVLDLFSGSGNLAFEALSEGASKAYLVDNNKQAINTINKNIADIKIKDAIVLPMNYKKALNYFKDNKQNFNLIFLDPPYKTSHIEESIKLITDYNLLKPEGILICESDRLDKIIYPNIYTPIKEKKYGDKYIVILKKV